MGGRLTALLLRNVEVEGRRLDVRLAEGRVAEIGTDLAAERHEIHGRGGALIPGLIDHHIHLHATAAAGESVRLDGAADAGAIAAMLRAAAARRPGRWLRATGFHEHRGGSLDRAVLDRIVPDTPVRVQHQTGSVWLLNSVAWEMLDLSDAPRGVDPHSGRIERADDWLRTQLGGIAPDLAPLGRDLAAFGVTGVTDASVGNDDRVAALFADAQASGALPQRIMMMGGGRFTFVPSARLMVGPVKIILDDHDLPPLSALIDRIGDARRWNRAVAVHCVTAGELALALAAFEEAGARPGDRIEHGGVIPESAIAVLAALGLRVVTQSAFVFERGDRYLAEVDADEQRDLYRCASLVRAGIRVGGSSDAPYATPDPWQAMRAATERRTLIGRSIAGDEAVDPRNALELYLGDFDDPGGPPRRVAVGAVADLCLLNEPLAPALETLSAATVAATIIAGRVAYDGGN